MKNTVSRIEVLKKMARDIEAGADYRNYTRQIYRSITYLIARDYDDHLDYFGGAFSDDFMCARNNSKLFDLVYLMDPSESPDKLIDIFYYVCYDDYYETAKYLIKQGVDVNYISENSQDLYSPESLFTEVYDRSYIDVAYLLLNAGIEINPNDFIGRKSKFGREKCEVIGFLIKKMYKLK